MIYFVFGSRHRSFADYYLKIGPRGGNRHLFICLFCRHLLTNARSVLQ